MRPSQRFARRSAFVRYASIAYVAVVAYASLYPLTGWRTPSHEMLWVRLVEWPRYYTYSDVFLNVLAYAPLGLLLTLMLRTRLPPMRAATLAVMFAVALSFAMEVLQAWVPARVPSALDVFCNAVGGLVGAWMGLAAAGPLLRESTLSRWRQHRLVPGALTDVGLTLIGLWLFTQLNTAPWLFGNGDLKHLLAIEPAAGYSPQVYIALEAGVTGFGLMAVAGLAGCIARDRVATLLGPVILAALVLKSIASLMLFNPGQPFLWATPGAGIGLGAGALLSVALLVGDLRARATGGLAALLVSVLLLNLAPDNPYLEETLQVWRHGHYWSFTGTTAIVSMLWPAAAALFLLSCMNRAPARRS
jgi:VanZ family protein